MCQVKEFRFCLIGNKWKAQLGKDCYDMGMDWRSKKLGKNREVVPKVLGMRL